MSEIEIRTAQGPQDMAEAARLMQAYKEALGLEVFDNPGQRADEVLPGPYAAADAGILLACRGAQALGVVAFKGIAPGLAEMKRLYVGPEGRGLGLGRALAVAVMAQAAAAGHRRMVLDTLPHLEAALALYRDLGFVPVERYNDNPLPEVLFFGCDLVAAA